MARVTKRDLEERLAVAERDLLAYREAFWAFTRGEEPVTLESGDFSVQVLGLHRMCGGVVIDCGHVHLADRFIGDASGCMHNPYMRELGAMVKRAQREALLASFPDPPPPEQPVLRLVQ